MSEDNKAEAQKKVDESWKDDVEREKVEEKTETPKEPTKETEVNFTLFLSTMGLQAYVALGEIPDPSSKQSTVNLPQAKYMIDMLGLIEEKTKGNLDQQESGMLSSILYEIRMKYMEKAKQGN